jgi:hypothetical protein
MKFPRTRSGEHAVQAVTVFARRPPGDGAPGAAGGGAAGAAAGAAAAAEAPAGAQPLGGPGLRAYTFTFCLERVLAGPYKDCWMTVGLRCGDYANV